MDLVRVIFISMADLNEEDDIRLKSKFRASLRLFAFITGTMLYLPYFLLSKDFYLVPGTHDFIGDIVIFCFSMGLAITSLIIWYKIYKQFKKDRTYFGFASGKNGFALAIEVLSEAILTSVLLGLKGSGSF